MQDPRLQLHDTDLHTMLLTGQSIPNPIINGAAQTLHGGRLSSYSGDPRDPSCSNRKITTYYQQCYFEGQGDFVHSLPWGVAQGWLRLRLGMLPLGVNQYTVPFPARSCPLCPQGIQDLQHLLFECPATAPLVTSAVSLGYQTFWVHCTASVQFLVSTLSQLGLLLPDARLRDCGTGELSGRPCLAGPLL